MVVWNRWRLLNMAMFGIWCNHPECKEYARYNFEIILIFGMIQLHHIWNQNMVGSQFRSQVRRCFFPRDNPVKIDTQEIHNLTGQHPAHPVGWIGKVESHLGFLRRPRTEFPRKPDFFFFNPIPSRELTYPTLGKGKSSSKCHFWGIC